MLITAAKPKLLFLVTEDWCFCSHRFPVATAALEAGYEVGVITRVHHHAKAIREAGLKLISLQRMRRLGLHPLRELAFLWKLWKIYSHEKPD